MILPFLTTYSGSGAFLKKTSGVYVYKARIAFRIPDKFYMPKYKAGVNNALLDLRSTIYWQPNLITNKDGEAVIKLYTTGRPTTYPLIMEGADMDGHISSMRRQITIQ